MSLKFKRAVKAENYLNLVPNKTTDIKWNLLNDGRVELTVVNKGFANKIAQVFFNAPEKSKIKLDEYGSCVWKNIDGEKTMDEISKELKRNFKEKAEPLYPRIIQFMRILKNEGYITWKGSRPDK